MTRKILFLIGLILPFTCVAAVTLYVNPYCVLYCEDWGNRNMANGPMDRTFMAYQIQHLKAKAAIFGDSRARRLDANHLGWHAQPVRNYGLDATTPFEMRRYFEHAETIQHLEQMIIVPDFTFWNNVSKGSFSESRLWRITGRNNVAKHYFTILQDFYLELFSSYSSALTMNNLSPRIKSALQQRLRTYKATNLSTTFFAQKGTALEELRSMILLAGERNADVSIIIPPLPLKRWINTVCSEQYYQWQRDLVSILDEAAEKYGKRFPLWDFSNDNTITHAPFPEKKNEWFEDLSHFNTTVGTMILNRVFRTCKEFCDVPSDFGVELTKDNIEQYIAKMRADSQGYLQEHPELKAR